jgi:hypothetical protein
MRSTVAACVRQSRWPAERARRAARACDPIGGNQVDVEENEANVSPAMSVELEIFSDYI